MAAVTPVTGNKCVGNYADLTPNIQLYCDKGTVDEDDNPIYTCATWKKFKVSCPSVNQLCSTKSSAWVAASVVCRQRLF